MLVHRKESCFVSNNSHVKYGDHFTDSMSLQIMVSTVECYPQQWYY